MSKRGTIDVEKRAVGPKMPISQIKPEHPGATGVLMPSRREQESNKGHHGQNGRINELKRDAL